jgi:hypothetical protein
MARHSVHGIMSVDVERKPFSVPEIWAGGLALATVVLIACVGLRVAEPQNAVSTLTRYASVSIQSETLPNLSRERPRGLSDAEAAPDVRSPDSRPGTGNATPIASNGTQAPAAADRTAPVAGEAVGLRKQQDGGEADMPSVLSGAAWGPPSLRDARLADSQRRNVSDASGVGAGATFVGSWTDDITRCRIGRKAPLVISARAAKTAISGCDFGLVTREAANRWRVAATCAAGGKSWRANIALKLIEPNLTWSSERGTAIYVRCTR